MSIIVDLITQIVRYYLPQIYVRIVIVEIRLVRLPGHQDIIWHTTCQNDLFQLDGQMTHIGDVHKWRTLSCSYFSLLILTLFQGYKYRERRETFLHKSRTFFFFMRHLAINLPEKEMNHQGSQSTSTKIERRIIEKNRRNQMKVLYSKLNSLLPNQSSKVCISFSLINTVSVFLYSLQVYAYECNYKVVYLE